MNDSSLKILLFSTADRAEGRSRWAWSSLLSPRDIDTQVGGLLS